eukprot:358733-Chlamydomonas_euryale.AAC.1
MAATTWRPRLTAAGAAVYGCRHLAPTTRCPRQHDEDIDIRMHTTSQGRRASMCQRFSAKAPSPCASTTPADPSPHKDNKVGQNDGSSPAIVPSLRQSPPPSHTHHGRRNSSPPREAGVPEADDPQPVLQLRAMQPLQPGKPVAHRRVQSQKVQGRKEARQRAGRRERAAWAAAQQPRREEEHAPADIGGVERAAGGGEAVQGGGGVGWCGVKCVRGVVWKVLKVWWGVTFGLALPITSQVLPHKYEISDSTANSGAPGVEQHPHHFPSPPTQTQPVWTGPLPPFPNVSHTNTPGVDQPDAPLPTFSTTTPVSNPSHTNAPGVDQPEHHPRSGRHKKASQPARKDATNNEALKPRRERAPRRRRADGSDDGRGRGRGGGRGRGRGRGGGGGGRGGRSRACCRRRWRRRAGHVAARVQHLRKHMEVWQAEVAVSGVALEAWRSLTTLNL